MSDTNPPGPLPPPGDSHRLWGRARHEFWPASPSGAAARIAVTVVGVFAMALWPKDWWRGQSVSVLCLMGATFWLCRRGGQWWSFARVLLWRAAVVWVFAGLMALGSLGQPDWPLRAGNLLLKSTLSLWAISLLGCCTSLPDLVGGLRYLRVPRVWTETFAFWGRYFAVLSEEWRRMQLARRARTFTPGLRREFKALSNALGLLFIRAYERAEQVHRAMLARGHREGE